MATTDDKAVEGKVWGATVGSGAGATISAFVLWLLGVFVFHAQASAGNSVEAVASVPGPVAGIVALAITAGGTFLGGYITKHTTRLTDVLDATAQAQLQLQSQSENQSSTDADEAQLADASIDEDVPEDEALLDTPEGYHDPIPEGAVRGPADKDEEPPAPVQPTPNPEPVQPVQPVTQPAVQEPPSEPAN